MKDATHTRIDFDNVSDLVAYCRDNSIPRGTSISSEKTDDRDFFRTGTYEEAVKLAESGWTQGAEIIAEHRDASRCFLNAAKVAKVATYGYDVSGDWLDVGRYLDGEPECFGIEVGDGEIVAQKVVSIRINSAVSGAVEADHIIARGIALLLAVDLLEACGTRVELILARGGGINGSASESTAAKGSTFESNTVIKEANQPVDIDRLAFWVAHPSAFRRFGFRQAEIAGMSPSNTSPRPMSDYGKRPGTVEIDELCTCSIHERRIVRQNVLDIVKKCGLVIDSNLLEEVL